ncbi:glucuronide transporter [Microbacterium deminutum]|uniref:Glucuronide transporter n=1 Tax=Microbacterium deminutum TaxID=344164 RepID=A0ABP5C6D1_9MICO
MSTTVTTREKTKVGLPDYESGKLRLRSIVGYGAGDGANNLAFSTATMFLLVYYTDVAGITAAAAGTLLLVVRIFDAFADVIAGRIVDRTYSRRFGGKFRPFILFGSLPLLVLSFLTFSVPQIGQTGMLLYAYLTYAALGFAYSMVNIPYGSLAGAMTQNPGERAKLGTARTVGAAVVGAVIGIVVAPMLKPGADLQFIFTVMTLSFIVIGMGLYLFTYFTTKERVVRTVQHVSTRQSFATLKGNRPLLMLCIASLLSLVGMLSSSTAQIYFLRDVFGALNLYAVLSLSQLVLIFVLAPFVPAIVRRFGKRNTFVAGGLVGVAGNVVAFLAPSVAIALPAMILAMVGLMLGGMVIWAIEADTVEYGEWKTGVRAEGITYALFSFTRKTGQAVGGALAAYALAIGGYVAGATTQTVSAEWGIRAGAALVPAIFILLSVIVMMFYPLTDKVHAKIVAEIAARRQAQGLGDEIAPDLTTSAFRSQDPTTLRPPAE